MGYALAEACANHGADVILVSGPVSMSIDHPKIKIINVQQTAEMFDKCHEYFSSASITILSAAVADYSPEQKIENKIKRKKEDLFLKLKPTRDIAASLGKIKRPDQLLAGFALETDDEEENALSKLKKKNFDLIVLNSLRDKGAGFQTDTNKVSIIDKNNNIDKFELKSKREVAEDIIEKIITLKNYD